MNNKKKAAPKAKEPIKLRSKQLANGNQSLYLDFYRDGKREYEFLKLYLVPERTPIDKTTNAQTLELANAVKSQKIVELQNAAHGFSISSTKKKINVIDYIQMVADQKQAKTGDARGTPLSIVSLIRQIEAYSGNKTTFKEVDKKYCEGFITHLSTTTNKNKGRENNLLSVNTQHQYITLFAGILNRAVSDEIIPTNPFKQIKTENKPKKQKSEVVYLSIDEVKMLENTPSLNPTIKQAFLFSCYTGLRFSDVAGLTWDKLQTDNNGGTYLNFVQEKTTKREYLPIPNKAISNLPDRGNAADTDKVFTLSSVGYVNLQLRQWAFQAGIKKYIHFHVARHTYATLLLTKEVPIETVSKNLGHAEIRTTQIYAKVINQAQREAVNKLDEI